MSTPDTSSTSVVSHAPEDEHMQFLYDPDPFFNALLKKSLLWFGGMVLIALLLLGSLALISDNEEGMGVSAGGGTLMSLLAVIMYMIVIYASVRSVYLTVMCYKYSQLIPDPRRVSSDIYDNIECARNKLIMLIIVGVVATAVTVSTQSVIALFTFCLLYITWEATDKFVPVLSEVVDDITIVSMNVYPAPVTMELMDQYYESQNINESSYDDTPPDVEE